MVHTIVDSYFGMNRKDTWITSILEKRHEKGYSVKFNDLHLLQFHRAG